MNLRGTAGRAGAWAMILTLALSLADGAGPVVAGEEADGPSLKPEPAKLKVRGCGPLNNRRLRQVLLSPEAGAARPEVFDANFIEDAAVLILSSVGEDGYLRPRLEAQLTLGDGTQVEYVWGVEQGPVLPRPLAVKAARLRVERGVRSHYRHRHQPKPPLRPRSPRARRSSSRVRVSRSRELTRFPRCK